MNDFILKRNILSFIEMIKKGKYIFAISIIEKISYAIIFIQLARKMSLHDYGVITTVFAFCSILSSVFELGFANYFHRESSYENLDLLNEIQNVLMFKYLSFILFLFISIIYVKTNLQFDILNLTLIALITFISGINNIFIRILYGKDKYLQSFLTVLISRIILLVVGTLFIIYESDLILLLSTFFIANILQGVLLYIYLKRNNIFIKFARLKLSILKKILYSSLPIGVGILFVWMYDRIDVLLIQNILGLEQVSFYSVAYSFYKLPQILSPVILLPLFTKLSKSYKESGKISFDNLKVNLLIIITISLFVFILYNLSSGFFIKILYGNKYIDSSWMLSLLVFAFPGLMLNNFTGVVLNSIGKEKIGMIATFFSLLVNVSLNIYLLSKMGIVAAIIATIVTEYTTFIIQASFIFKNRKYLIEFA